MRIVLMARPPDFLENLPVGQNFSSMTRQQPEQFILDFGKLHFFTANGDASRRHIHHQIFGVKAGHVQTIMSLRYEEIFKIIAGELSDAGLSNLLRAGVLLCGGGAHVRGIVALAEKIFQMNVAVGHAGGISGLAKSLDEPEFATAIGLVKYGSLRQRKPAERLSWWTNLKELVKRLYSYIAGSYSTWKR